MLVALDRRTSQENTEQHEKWSLIEDVVAKSGSYGSYDDKRLSVTIVASLEGAVREKQ
jgi:hypothetical protein